MVMKNKEEIARRVAALRRLMREKHLDAFIFPSTDPHNGEYVPDHWKGREWISGFDGSAGTAVVTMDKAALWTDSRYFIAAAEQLDGTEYALMRERVEGTPSVAEWLASCLSEKPAARVGVDGMVNSASEVAGLTESLGRWGDFEVVTDIDPLETIWEDRPPVPKNKVVVHPLEYAGETAREKIGRIRRRLTELGANAILVSSLDDIAWTLNMRGSDVHCNPVFVSYLLISDEEVVLFIDADKLTDEVVAYLQGEGVATAPYKQTGEVLSRLGGGAILLDPGQVNHMLYHAVNCEVLPAASPIPTLKAVKNAAEIAGFRQAMIRDGVAMVRFLRWLEEAVPAGGESELSVDRKLTSLRAEQPLFKGLSFDTIAGYQAHGAIVHYEATAESNVMLRPEGLLLLDSGGQYLDGTTDITRTIALGPVSEQERRVYTLVLKGHLRLQALKFPDGACGSQLDAVARQPLWQEGLNFLHGTGHGVGAYLNVHEGPHQIRMEWKPAPLKAGMTVTDEPGIYVEGKFGVRIENTLLITPYKETPFGRFLQFEPLTLCPIDLKAIDTALLNEEEKSWLNGYHRMVYDKLAPHLDPEEAEWLKKATSPLP